MRSDEEKVTDTLILLKQFWAIPNLKNTEENGVGLEKRNGVTILGTLV